MRTNTAGIRILTGMLALLLLPIAAVGDTLVLRDGRVLQGKYLGGAPDRVIFNVNGEVQEIFVSSLITLTFSATVETAAPSPASAAPAPAPAAVSAQRRVQAPAGARLVVRTDAPLASNKSEPGDRFAATLETDIAVNGAVVIPKGSKAYGRIVESSGAKRLAGKARLVLELTDVTVNGQLQPILTDKFGVQGADAVGGTAAKIGAGTLIGAVIDGKEGAAKGAAAGGALSLLTKGEQIHIPAQTVLEFRLQQPVTVQLR